MKNIKDKYTDEMFEGILKLKNVDDCYKFFSDLCTPREIKSMAQRFTVAKMLIEKRVYSDIVNETGASTATISRVNRSLESGNEGYDLVFDRSKK
ncbi:MAG: TrpR-like protein, YerC/YecD [Clostridia bacterium]|nr:TrpR-like protein, YerC/YecD [Clostridia bacterium]MBQ2390106.1 TrpR-like protein, YerC/YecD [Clostridia bacterium]MBQ3563932.1 TrpR-like protein, YerC/YecD [Clostridia bacterium]MBQ5717171.1 TrpR-like protein, YerC/YecD [Clostridia bacterium]MBQ9958629.1 TrpR-like protein, YerC/YecD [Clostridia bacterium]